MATDKNKHLECVIESHKINKEQKLLDKHHEKRKEIKEFLELTYSDNLYTPFNSGSIAKSTAINSKFDIDLMSPFKRNAFGSNGTLKEMFDNVYNLLFKEYGNKQAVVRKQKVSIGLEFYPDAEGDIVKIDVVPGRELNLNAFLDDKRLYLYVNEQFGTISEGSEHLLSNINAQINHIRNRAESQRDSLRKVIRLLKVWKIGKGSGPKSFYLELISIKAFDSKSISGDLWEKLKAVLEFIRDNAETVSLVDPGNSGNNVSDTLTDLEKSTLCSDMKTMLIHIDANDDWIKSYFRVNEKFPCAEDNEDIKYGIKKEGISNPPPNRFG